MHGRPRQPKGVTQDPAKVKLYSELMTQVLQHRAARQYDKQSLALAGKLLVQNPELYTVWNFRREGLQDVLEGALGPEAARAAAEGELALSFAALKRNPKSYSTWHHRKWVVERRLLPLERELRLVKELLGLDSRNFMGWAYWRWLCGLMGLAPEEQEAYVRGRVGDNFSNYSAWHARTSVLPAAHAEVPAVSLEELMAQPMQGGRQAPAAAAAETTAGANLQQPLPAGVLAEELDLVKQAFYTEPHDQSGWLYLRWLLANAQTHWQLAQGTGQEGPARQAYAGVLQEQADVCREVLDLERQLSAGDDTEDRSGEKWPLLMLAHLLEMQAQLRDSDVAAGGPQPSAAGEQRQNRQEPEVRQLYTELVQVDPMRRGFYQDAAAGKVSLALQLLLTPAGSC